MSTGSVTFAYITYAVIFQCFTGSKVDFADIGKFFLHFRLKFLRVCITSFDSVLLICEITNTSTRIILVDTCYPIFLQFFEVCVTFIYNIFISSCICSHCATVCYIFITVFHLFVYFKSLSSCINIELTTAGRGVILQQILSTKGGNHVRQGLVDKVPLAVLLFSFFLEPLVTSCPFETVSNLVT